jgi:protein-tyrosine phosphatase
MAQAIAADAAARAGIDVRVASAGTAALEGHPADENACAALEPWGLDLSRHRARQLTRELVNAAALVVTATRRQRDDVRHFFPADAAKIVSFDDATGFGDLGDPYGDGKPAFERTADLLRRGMPGIMTALRSRL